MRHTRLAARIATTVSALAAFAMLTAPTIAPAQERPKDLTVLPPVPTDYTPKKTEWGDYDFRGNWPIENINNGHILFQRPKEYGNRFWVNDEEFQRRVEAAKKNDGSYAAASDQGIGTSGTQGLVNWFETTNFAKRTSMLVSPADGQLPLLTEKGEALFKAGRSGWVPGQDYDWVSDFDSWDRCISRGFPASMYPFRYNNGIRVFQSPGYIVIQLEMLGTRVIPIGDTPAWPGAVEGWLGDSRAHWEGKTLVIETTNIKSGDSATHNAFARSAAPLNMATQFTGTADVAAFNTVPTSKEAKTVERLTMTGPNTIVHELTYSDPEVYTKPWTTRIEWTRDDDYQFFEYACHEGNHMPRDYISASRAHRAAVAAGDAEAVTAENDDRARFAQPFDHDPGTGPRPMPKAK